MKKCVIFKDIFPGGVETLKTQATDQFRERINNEIN